MFFLGTNLPQSSNLFPRKLLKKVFGFRSAPLSARPALAGRPKTEKFSLHFFDVARPNFLKSLPRHQLCRIILFQKIKAEGGFAFKLLVIAFFFKVGVWGKRKIFCFVGSSLAERRKRATV